MNELICSKCEHKFFVDNYDYGSCPNCGKTRYYWDDGCFYEEECCYEDFYWDNK